MNNNYKLHVLDYLGVDPITQFNRYRLDVYLNSTDVKLLAKRMQVKILKLRLLAKQMISKYYLMVKSSFHK